jgi:hypothetical protein
MSDSSNFGGNEKGGENGETKTNEDFYYALYLVPLNPVRFNTNANNNTRHCVSELEELGHWGGLVHITLCSFAMKFDSKNPGQEQIKMHKSCIVQAAEEAAQNATNLYSQAFHITKEKWQGENSTFRICKSSKTLDTILRTLAKHECYKPRNDVKKLHVTMLDSARHYNSDVIDYLSSCQWKIVVVKREINDQYGEHLMTEEEFQVGL